MEEEHNMRFRFFAGLLYAGAGFCILWATLASPMHVGPLTFLVWILLCFLGRKVSVDFKLGSLVIAVPISTSINLAALFLHGLSFMLWVNLLGRFLYSALQRVPLYRTGITVGVWSVTYSLGAYGLGVPSIAADLPRLILPAFCFQFYVVTMTSFLLDLFHALHNEARLRKLLAAEWGEFLPANLSEVFLQPMLALVFITVYVHEPWAIVLLGIPFYGLRWVMGHRSRVEQEVEKTMLALSDMLDAKDDYTERHTDRVSQYAQVIAKHYGIPDAQIPKIGWAAKMHDIGKIFVREDVLRKSTKLTREEYEHIQSHVKLDHFLNPLLGTNFKVIEIIHLARLHHERYDGRGYPFGLKGESIPLEARIISVADAWDAMTSRRVYRESFSDERAVELLKQGSGQQWDPLVVDAFARAYESGEIRSVGAAYRAWIKKKKAETLERFEQILILGA